MNDKKNQMITLLTIVSYLLQLTQQTLQQTPNKYM